MNLSVDWVSLFWGVTLALLLINFWSLFKAYVARSRAKKKLVEVSAKLEAIKQDFMKQRDELKQQIEKEKK